MFWSSSKCGRAHDHSCTANITVPATAAKAAQHSFTFLSMCLSSGAIVHSWSAVTRDHDEYKKSGMDNISVTEQTSDVSTGTERKMRRGSCLAWLSSRELCSSISSLMNMIAASTQLVVLPASLKGFMCSRDCHATMPFPRSPRACTTTTWTSVAISPSPHSPCKSQHR